MKKKKLLMLSIYYRHYNDYDVIDITNGNIRYKKIFPKIKEKGKQMRGEVLLIVSLMT